MAQAPNQKTGHRRSRGRENRRVARDKKIFGFLRRMVSLAEHLHQDHGEPIEPLSVFYGKPEFDADPNIPWDAELTRFPIGVQENGKPMPQWEDLSQWMKVMMATMVGHQWDLLTFNIHLHPDLERDLVAAQSVRFKLAERVRKHLGRAVGMGREFFFVIEGHSKDTLTPTFLHIHGAAAVYEAGDADRIETAIAGAAGHVRGASKQRRAVHSAPFTTLRAGYGDYLFKFAKQFDPRLDDRRLVMSNSMTSAARDLWIDITRPHLRSERPPAP
jgi:hypothetical protein